MIQLSQACPTDIVVDTNVLEHAENAGVPQHASALGVLDFLRSSDTVMWVLDDQGKAAPNLSTSVLACEYQATLQPQGFALTLLVQYLGSGRIKFSPRPGADTRKMLRQLVPRNVNDQAVLGAAVGAADRFLVSNDLADFDPAVRSAARKKLKVEICESTEVAA